MTYDEYHAMLERIHDLMKDDPTIDTSQGGELNELVNKALAYEREHYPMMFAHAMQMASWGHLDERTCTAETPMAMEDKDAFYWHHPDAAEVGKFFNLSTCRCPHCGLTFNATPRPA